MGCCKILKNIDNSFNSCKSCIGNERDTISYSRPNNLLSIFQWMDLIYIQKGKMIFFSLFKETSIIRASFILKIEKWTKWDNIIFKMMNIIIIIIKTKKEQDYCLGIGA